MLYVLLCKLHLVCSVLFVLVPACITSGSLLSAMCSIFNANSPSLHPANSFSLHPANSLSVCTNTTFSFLSPKTCRNGRARRPPRLLPPRHIPRHLCSADCAYWELPANFAVVAAHYQICVDIGAHIRGGRRGGRSASKWSRG